MGWMGISVILITAVIADLLSLVPFVGDIVGPIFWVCVSIYLWSIGCGLLNARRLATSIISMVAEMIPLVQELPLIFAGALAVIILVRIEDKTGKKLMPGSNKLSGSRKPLYNNGVRQPEYNVQNNVSRSINIEGVRPPNGGLST